jgi:16S rRNA G966 N2-methylase RsmD
MAIEYITLDHIDTKIPQDFEELILTDNEAVFDYYWRNVELHKGPKELAIREVLATKQDHRHKSSDQILRDISQVTEKYKIKYEGVQYSVGPGIYPSNQFLSSCELHKIAGGIEGQNILDYGCSHGFVGLATRNSKRITFVDINPVVEGYLRESIALNDYDSRSEVIIGNLPDLGPNTYDAIFFNPPFHLEDTQTGIGSSLKDDSSVRIIENFWEYVQDYMHESSIIYCAFSNRDLRALKLLEQSIDQSGLRRELIIHKFADSDNDLRIYRVTR